WVHQVACFCSHLHPYFPPDVRGRWRLANVLHLRPPLRVPGAVPAVALPRRRAGERLAPYPRRTVVINAEHIGGRGDPPLITGAHETEVAHVGEVAHEVIGVPLPYDRVEEDPIPHRVDLPSRFAILAALRVGGTYHVEVEGDGDPGAIAQDAPDASCTEPMGKVEVMGRGKRRLRFLASRGVHPGGVSEERRAPGFVHGAPQGDPIPEPAGHFPGVVSEMERGIPVRPAPSILQILGQIPVIEREDGVDSPFEETVDQTIVEIDT